jgi:2-polyprenyl-3-methyl-5-hydroxy-6-metoxy-1,4-benzoquinol methylase
VAAHLERRYGYETGLNRWSAILALLAIGHPGGAAELGFRVMYLQRPQAGAQLLDVGCGSGQFLDRMRSLGWTVRGLDPDPAAVEVATSRGLDVRLGQLGPKTYGDSTFDAVCLSHSIEHLADPGAVLSECRRVLKPDGVLVVATPNLDSWGHRLFGASWIHVDPPRHQHLFRKASLLRLMRDRGLRVDAAFTTSRTARFVWSASHAVARSGRAVLGGPRARRELAGVPFQLLQRLLLAFRPTAGEELIVLARGG